MSLDSSRSGARPRALARIVVGVLVVVVVTYSYALRIAADDGNPFDFFGYFTNQTSTLTALVLMLVGCIGLAGRSVPRVVALAWAIGAACLVVVAVVYNGLVPGTGSAPPWVSVVLHVVFPVLVVADVATAPDRHPDAPAPRRSGRLGARSTRIVATAVVIEAD